MLAKFEKNFNDPDRRADPLNSAELQTLDKCADEALELLGENALVSAMITQLKAILFYAERESRQVSFDAAHRHVGPILAAVEGTYDLPGYSGSRPATKSRRISPIVMRIDDKDS